MSFAEVFSLFDEKKLNLRKVMNSPVFSIHWAIVNEDMVSKINQKNQFFNFLQSLSPIPPSK